MSVLSVLFVLMLDQSQIPDNFRRHS